MDSKKTFFSYSRTDSAFTLRLAKDLRDAGVPIWLDQLDIQAGSRWDASIEAALETAGRLIVVLSPESVASVNVMDEVSYALGNDITIIPVLLTDCKTPFRISRLQRIDFSGDYDTGLTNLLHALKHAGESNISSAEGSPQQQQTTGSGKATALKSKKAGMTSEKATAAPQKNANPLKYILIGGGLVFLIFLIWGIASMGPDESENLSGDPVVETVAESTELQLGDAYEGGIVFEIDSSGEHGLIAASQDIAGSFSFDEAVQACEDLERDGYTDWYLPNKLELRKLYLKRDVIGGFEGIDYWSSSEDPDNPEMGYGLRFDVEGMSYGDKAEAGAVRAIRRF